MPESWGAGRGGWFRKDLAIALTSAHNNHDWVYAGSGYSRIHTIQFWGIVTQVFKSFPDGAIVPASAHKSQIWGQERPVAVSTSICNLQVGEQAKPGHNTL